MPSRTLVRRAEHGDRRIVSWSEHDLDVVRTLRDEDPELVARFEACYANARAFAEYWRNKLHDRGRPEQGRLADYLALIGYAIPDEAEAGHVGDTIRALRPGLTRGAALTPAQQARWDRLVERNRFDCAGMRAVCLRATRELEAAVPSDDGPGPSPGDPLTHTPCRRSRRGGPVISMDGGAGARAGRPLLLLDGDGVLNPLGVRDLPGFTPHELGESGTAGHVRVLLSPDHGRWLTAPGDVFDLVWATSWKQDADLLIAARAPERRARRRPWVAGLEHRGGTPEQGPTPIRASELPLMP